MTTIVPAVPSQVPHLIFHLGSQITSETVSATSATFEGSFYASLQAGSPMQTNRVVKWMRESAISQIHEIQTVFNTANALIIVCYAKKFVGNIQNRFQLSVINLTAAWSFGTLPVILAIGTAYYIGVLTMHRFSKDPVADEIYDSTTISEKTSNQQEIAKMLHVTKLVLNIGLACIAKNRFWFLVGLAGSSYSLLKNLSIQRLYFSRRIEIPRLANMPEIAGITITYKMLALEPQASSVDKTCAICLNNKIDMAFCTNHVFHKHCIGQFIAIKSNDFINDLQLTKTRTRHYLNGIYTHTTYSHSVTIQEKHLPSCPLCRARPLQNDCKVLIHDSILGDCDASVTIQRRGDNQSLFEKFYATYNIVQASLAYLQQYPELAAGIYSIQEVMIATDIFGLCGTAYYLQKRLKEKLNISAGSLAEAAYCIAAAATFIAMGALSYFAVLQINAYLRSALVLKDILAQLEIPSDTLNTIEVQWSSATILQSLYLMRMTMSVALAFFSKQRLLSLWNTAAQAFSFTAISRLKWINFSQTLDNYPLEKVFAEGGTHTSALNA